MEERKNGAADVTDVVVLLDEKNREHQFIIVEVVEVAGKKYAVLDPMEQEEEGSVLLRFERDEEGHDILVGVEQDEWELVVAAIDDSLS